MTTPALTAVHHLKLPVSDLPRSRSWYTGVLGLRVQQEFTDDDGVVRGVAGALLDAGGRVVVHLALRVDPAVAGMQGFDPLALTVGDADSLQAWAAHLDALGVPSAPVGAAPTGTALAVHDPDGLEIRLFAARAS